VCVADWLAAGEYYPQDMEQFEQFVQEDPNYEHCGYTGEAHDKTEPEFYTREQAMLAHIP